MKISDIIDFNDYTVKWDEVAKIKEFKILQETEQTPIWHAEGVVWNHLQRVVDEMYKLVPYDGENDLYRLIMVLSALFHDIGKGETTFFSEEKQDWSSPKHDKAGEHITRRLLWDADFIVRESVCYFVRNHMKPLYISESHNKLYDVVFLSHDSCNLKYCTNENLIKMKEADCRGSIMMKEDGWQDKLEYARMLCQEQNCYTQPYPFKNEMSKFRYFNERTTEYPVELYDDTEFTAYVMVGLPGSGKSTIATTHPLLKKLPIVSRDTIREELKLIKKGVKAKLSKKDESAVTERETSMIKGYCAKKCSFVVDNINIRKVFRNMLVEMVREYNGRVVFIYVEQPTLQDNINNRKDDISKDTFINLVESMSFPSPTDCFDFIVCKL